MEVIIDIHIEGLNGDTVEGVYVREYLFYDCEEFNLNEYIPDCSDSRKTGSNYDTIKIYQNILSRIYSEYFIDGRPIRGVSNLALSSSLISVKMKTFKLR